MQRCCLNQSGQARLGWGKGEEAGCTLNVATELGCAREEIGLPSQEGGLIGSEIDEQAGLAWLGFRRLHLQRERVSESFRMWLYSAGLVSSSGLLAR